MRVLVMGAPGPAMHDAVRLVEHAGHEVVRCTDPGNPIFPCKALTDTCPLDEGAVDVALSVRAHPWPRPTPMDRGVTCAVRQHIPIVLSGGLVLHPYEEWATEAIPNGADVVEALERAVDAPLGRHTEIATAAFRACLEAGGRAAHGNARAEARRRNGRLSVRLFLPEGTSPIAEEQVAVRVTNALREFDARAQGIEIRIVRPETHRNV